MSQRLWSGYLRCQNTTRLRSSSSMTRCMPPARARSPILSLIKTVRIEGPIDAQMTTEAGETVDLAGTEIGTSFGYSLPDIIDGSYDGVITAIDEAAESYARTAAGLIFDRLRTVTDATGMTQQVSGGPITWDNILDMLDKMEWGFDRDGNPQMPAIVTNPATQVAPPEQRHHDRLAEIAERKREEHRAARGTRRLS